MIDRPAPGSGYLALLLGGALGAGLFLVLVALELHGTATPAVILYFFIPAGAMLGSLHAAIRTRYEIAEGRLRLRSGILFAEIQCSKVAAVERVGSAPRMLVWHGGRGFANRLTDVLRITLESGALYYISPTDPATFAARIRAAASR